MDTFNPFSLQGKRILVTGASSGIGRGVALACSRMGASVIATGRNLQRLEETVSEMSGEDNLYIKADLTEGESVSEMVDKLPMVDGIVHCAGIGQRVLCKMLQSREIDEVMDINFKSPVLLQAEILKHKKINKGASVIFLASLAADSPSVGNAVYSASKAALISYSKCLSVELAPRGIRVNCISPAMVWTDLILQGGVDVETLKEDEKRYPLKRYGTPDDIANLAVYLLSDASSWMTGSNVQITGGGD